MPEPSAPPPSPSPVSVPAPPVEAPSRSGPCDAPSSEASPAARSVTPPRPTAPPSVAPPRPADHALPTRGLLGRSRELKALRADIERAGLDTLSGRKSPRSRVLLIAGRPGCGRTALAEELLRTLSGTYPDGVFRARLSGPDGTPVPTGDVARGLLTALGAAVPAGSDDDEPAEALRAELAARRAVLLLDDAPGADHVEPLLPDAPDCLVVVVSEGPLTGIPDVRPCTLGGLDGAAAVALLARFAGPVRITVDPRSADSVIEECGGQPAALVLAGGWLAARPKASVSDLRTALRAVEIPDELPLGERPLYRAFHLAHDGLPPSTARTLRLLSLAPPGLVDAHTTSALAGCTVETAKATLADLAALGLLHREADEADDGASSPGTATGPRHRLPGCLAVRAAELLRTHERPAEVQLARARMLERTVRLLQSCRGSGEPPGSPAWERAEALPFALRFPSRAAAAAWLHRRRAALLDAARLAVSDGELDTLDRRLIATLVRALMAHEGPTAAAGDLYALHELVLEVAERRGLGREKAAALLNLADLDGGAGRTEAALTRYRGALEAARSAGDAVATGRALESLGGTYSELGDWQRAADWYGRALELRLSRGETADAARLHGRIGGAHGRAGRWPEALKEWRAAARTSRRLGDLAGQARATAEVARVQERAGRPEEALRTSLEALHTARGAGEAGLEAGLQLRIADLLDGLGDPAAARLHRAAGEQLLQDHPK
ncbi:tetratricopeptide repeat protein [Streptomyces catenulae]|uniref:tetratricopeptide repeat protein n=1 Tax=Streptomyces catenulae TaxID=66875 RepID=UPI000D170A1D